MELQCWVTAARTEAVLVSVIPHDDATPYGEPFTVTLTSARAYGSLGSSLTSGPLMVSFKELRVVLICGFSPVVVALTGRLRFGVVFLDVPRTTLLVFLVSVIPSTSCSG